MKSRNPIARFAFKCNVAKAFPAKRGRGSIFKRDKKVDTDV